MMQVESSNNYDPMYCLSEHLEYFNESVAGHLNLMQYDFDDIFGNGFDAIEADPFLAPPPAKKAKLMAPPSPKSVAILAPPSPKSVMSEEMVEQQRERAVAVVSPATVESSPTTVYPDIAPSTTTPTSAPETPIEKPKPRKRQISATKTASPRVAASQEEREDARRERNRQHAKRSRQRKREFMNCLEESVQHLKDENQKLMQMLGLASGASSHAIISQREEEMQEASSERFIAALKQPENRVLSDDALASLRELFD